MVLGRVELTLDLEWHSRIFRHIFTFQVHTVQCVKSTLSLVGSVRSPFAIGTHSAQYYDAPKNTLCLWRALPVPKDCEESNHVNVLNWATPPCSKSTFKEYGGWWNTCEYVSFPTNMKNKIKSGKENSQLGSRQPLASVGDQAFSFQLRPYIPQTYILTVYYTACYILLMFTLYIAICYI